MVNSRCCPQASVILTHPGGFGTAKLVHPGSPVTISYFGQDLIHGPPAIVGDLADDLFLLLGLEHVNAIQGVTTNMMSQIVIICYYLTIDFSGFGEKKPPIPFSSSADISCVKKKTTSLVLHYPKWKRFTDISALKTDVEARAGNVWSGKQNTHLSTPQTLIGTRRNVLVPLIGTPHRSSVLHCTGNAQNHSLHGPGNGARGVLGEQSGGRLALGGGLVATGTAATRSKTCFS